MPLVALTPAQGGIARLTIDRPDQRNALSIRVRDEMSDGLDRLSEDEDVRVVVISSSGPAFCAGFDLPEFEDASIQDSLWASSDRWHERLRTFPLPLIASIQGATRAGGFDLASMCDLRIAARSATFARPELMWSAAIYSIVHDLVGGSRARELGFTNRTLTAETALDIGLVNDVVDDDQLADATMALAREVAALDRGSLRHTKAMAIDRAKTAEAAAFTW
jgi:enoyl-CoA hydratase